MDEQDDILYYVKNCKTGKSRCYSQDEYDKMGFITQEEYDSLQKQKEMDKEND